MLGDLLAVLASIVAAFAPPAAPPSAPLPSPEPAKPVPVVPVPPPPALPAMPAVGDPVERWRPHVERSGLPVEWTLRTMRCESGGNPSAVNRAGPYVGLMQVWRGSTDPETNLAQAYSIYQRQGRRAWPVCGRR